MRKYLQQTIDTFAEAYKNSSGEDRAKWDRHLKFMQEWEEDLKNRPKNPYAEKLINRMMNNPESRKVFNEELDRLLGPDE